MNTGQKRFGFHHRLLWGVLAGVILTGFTGFLSAEEGIGFPSRKWGLGLGNSPVFNGIRFNLADRDITRINGINITLWKSREEEPSGRINGISLGVVPQAREFTGIQCGLLGVAAGHSTRGLTLGLLGSGCGGEMTGIHIGGLGIGCGDSMTGINIGGLGVGAGEDLRGLNVGGLGVGAGEKLTGVNLSLLGIGAGETVTGVNIAGLGIGAGEALQGLTVAGLGAGSPEFCGVGIAGLGLGGNVLKGLFIAGGTVQVRDGGSLTGLAVSAFNYIRGTQKGVAVGLVNYAYRLKGIQIGLINIVRDNPSGRKMLPIININF